MIKYKKKILNVFLIHKNKDKLLIKKYIKNIKKRFILNKKKFIFINIIFFVLKKNFKNKIKKIKILILLIWKGKHKKDIKKIIKNFIKINKNFSIKLLNNFGKCKKIIKIIKKII
ncbi:MAG: hypothetical protein ACSHUF_00335 [Candidatus Nasuia deltocephalinicola]